MTPEALQARLDYVTTFTDDEHWCGRTAAELSVTTVKITDVDHPVYGIEVAAEGLVHALEDPRAVALVRSALAYRRGSGVRLRADSNIVTVAFGRPAFASIGGRTYASVGPVDDHMLESLMVEGSGFGAILSEEVAAS